MFSYSIIPTLFFHSDGCHLKTKNLYILNEFGGTFRTVRGASEIILILANGLTLKQVERSIGRKS